MTHLIFTFGCVAPTTVCLLLVSTGQWISRLTKQSITVLINVRSPEVPMLLLCNFLPSSIFLCNVSIQFNESLYMKPRLQVFLPFLCFKSVNGNVSGELNKRKITCIISLVQGILLAYCFTTSYFIYIEPCHKCTIKMTN